MARTPSVQAPDDPEAPQIIRASELGQYVFCRRAWWLGAVLGYPSANQRGLTDGILAHAQHGRRVASAETWQRVARALWLAGLVLVIGYGLHRALAGGLF